MLSFLFDLFSWYLIIGGNLNFNLKTHTIFGLIPINWDFAMFCSIFDFVFTTRLEEIHLQFYELAEILLRYKRHEFKINEQR